MERLPDLRPLRPHLRLLRSAALLFDRDGDALSKKDLSVFGLRAQPGREITHGTDRGIAGALPSPADH